MIARFHCDDETLDRLLHDSLREDEQDVVEHVETCDVCQEKIDTLSRQGLSWEEVGDLVGSVGKSAQSTPGEKTTRDNCPAFLQPSDDPDSIGRFSRYEIKRILGRGGMGIVMQALDTSLGRHCAVKVLAPELASSAAARKRFSREAKSAAAVVHPHVVPIQTVDEHDGLPYLVMPVVEGQSLQQRVETDGPLSTIETVRIAAQVAAGLAAAHDQGLVHRDIKPANILLESGVERVQITDFGLARAVDDASMTRSGVIAGTPQYMSPEQAHGDEIDHRSDLFSLGSVMYFMLTGRSPFRAETTMGVLNRIGNDEPRRLQAINPNIPLWLENIVMKLLPKSPVDRLDSAHEIAELLEHCLAHVQQPSTTPLPEKLVALVPNQNRCPPIGKLVGVAAFVFSLILAGVLIVLELDKGTLTIESELDDVPIRIVQDDKVVESLTVSRDGTSTRIAAGKYTVEIEQDFDTAVVADGVVEISRGGTQIVKLTRTRSDQVSVVSYNISDFLDLESMIPIKVQMQSLIELIQSTIKPDTWNGDRFSIVPYPQNNSLVVRQTDLCHGAISQFFDQLSERRKELETEVLDIVADAKTVVSKDIDQLKNKIAALPATTERSPESHRLQVELKRAEALLEEISKETVKIVNSNRSIAQPANNDTRSTEDLSLGSTSQMAIYPNGSTEAKGSMSELRKLEAESAFDPMNMSGPPFGPRSIVAVTAYYNKTTRQLRHDLFDPPIPDLTTEQMKSAMVEAAKVLRKNGKVSIASALEESVASGRLVDRLECLGMTGPVSEGFRQIVPAMTCEAGPNHRTFVALNNAELRYSRDGWSSSTWGDLHPPISGDWELVSIEQSDETLTKERLAEWKRNHPNWSYLEISKASVAMIGDDTRTYDFEIDYDTGPLPKFRISQDGNTKHAGVLMGNGFADDTELKIAVDIDGNSTPKTFHTKDGVTTKLSYLRTDKTNMSGRAKVLDGKGNAPRNARNSIQQTLGKVLQLSDEGKHREWLELVEDDAIDRMAGIGLIGYAQQKMSLLMMGEMVSILAETDAEVAETLRTVAETDAMFRTNPASEATAAFELLTAMANAQMAAQIGGDTPSLKDFRVQTQSIASFSQLLRQASGVLSDRGEFMARLYFTNGNPMLRPVDSSSAEPDWEIDVEGKHATAFDRNRSDAERITIELNLTDQGQWQICKLIRDQDLQVMMMLMTGESNIDDSFSTSEHEKPETDANAKVGNETESDIFDWHLMPVVSPTNILADVDELTERIRTTELTSDHHKEK